MNSYLSPKSNDDGKSFAKKAIQARLIIVNQQKTIEAFRKKKRE